MNRSRPRPKKKDSMKHNFGRWTSEWVFHCLFTFQYERWYILLSQKVIKMILLLTIYSCITGSSHSSNTCQWNQLLEKNQLLERKQIKLLKRFSFKNPGTLCLPSKPLPPKQTRALTLRIEGMSSPIDIGISDEDLAKNGKYWSGKGLGARGIRG